MLDYIMCLQVDVYVVVVNKPNRWALPLYNQEVYIGIKALLNGYYTQQLSLWREEEKTRRAYPIVLIQFHTYIKKHIMQLEVP